MKKEIFTIENNTFYNNFFYEIEEFKNSLYKEINHAYINDKLFKYFFKEEELEVLILFNKFFFQHLTCFFEMIKNRMAMPAFNELRSGIECLRMYRVFYNDKEFRKKYIQNQNWNFDSMPDYEFKQSKIIKILEDREKEIRKQEKIPLTTELHNHDLTKGGVVSRLHSELSKFSHLLNVNLILPLYTEKNRIYLDIKDEYNERIQYVIRKYTEASFILLETHLQTFVNCNFSKETEEMFENLLDEYSKFIKLAYKK